jgi:hypothetical protein
MAPMEYLGAWGTLIHEKNLKSKISCQTPFKGTVSSDRFKKFRQKFTELGLTKGRGWFLNFLGAPMILKCKR